MTPAELITNYLKIREKKRQVELRHTEELKKYNEALNAIETTLGKLMDDTGLDNLPGGGGTAYKIVRSSVTVSDWDAFLNWVKTTESWHLLERRAAKTAVEEVLAETSYLPPGINMARSAAVQVRKN